MRNGFCRPVTLTFDLSTQNWLYTSSCSAVRLYQFWFLYVFFIFELRARTGQTDRQTDGEAIREMQPIGRPHNNITIVIDMTMFRVLLSWQSHCESSPGSFDEYRTAPGGRRFLDQAIWLELQVRLWAAMVSTSTFALYYYSARRLILI